MDLKHISDDLSLTGQITPDDMAQISANGFKSVICNRPDGEEPGQPSFDMIADAAQTAGLEVRYIPVTASTMTEDDGRAFGEALDTMPAPILAYCRSGARCGLLLQLAQSLRG